MNENMDNFYDVIVVGGSIAGSVAAKFTAQAGLKTLLIEKFPTPRDKACSGIQWHYLSKIIGEKIPRERLCKYQIKNVIIEYPTGQQIKAPTKMLNFMRKPFDDWLNLLAKKYGATFRDSTKLIDFKSTEGGYILELNSSNGKSNGLEVKCKYLVDASGMQSDIRRKLRPQDFDKKYAGKTINYYIKGTADMDPEALYQFWNVKWNDVMFAWVYTKTLDDGETYWVVGTGCNEGSLKERQESFYHYIQEKYNLRGEIIKREGFGSNMNFREKDSIWLGNKRILAIGDAAGLIDEVRGVGMDIAALSGRIAAQAIVRAEKEQISRKGRLPEDVLSLYQHKMRRLIVQLQKNRQKPQNAFSSNEDLMHYLKKSFTSMTFNFLLQMALNKIRRPEKLVLLPP